MRIFSALTFLLLALAPRYAPGADLYVSPGGSDANPGSKAAPFKTLERARDAIRAGRKSAAFGTTAVTVWVDGVLPRDHSFELSAEDSGTAGAPVVYRAAPGRAAVLQAGRVISPADFHPVTDAAVLARIDPLAKGKVLELDLGAVGITHVGPFPDVFDDGGNVTQLFFGSHRMTLARWPNEGYTTIQKVLDHGKEKGPDSRGASFIYRDDRPARWHAEDGVWLDGFWRVPWEPRAIRVKSIDLRNHQITFTQGIPGGVGSKYAGAEGSGKENYYVINVLEELDQPGEWCIDFKTRRLYFWPPAPLDSAPVRLADMETPMVWLRGASHVIVRGITFECGLGNAVEIRGGEGNCLAGCTFHLIGKNAAVIDGGSHNGALSCDMFDLGHGGVVLSGGDRPALAPCDNYAVNNHIHHYGQVKKTYAPGVLVGIFGPADAVGCRVQHNLIHDAPHSAVIYSGNDGSYEYNEVRDIGLDSGDVGAFYTWGDWTSQGNVLRYNFVYDSPRANAFYMDDGDSGDTVFGNVVLNLSYGPFISGGHDNVVRNNVIIDCNRGMHLDARGVARGYNASNKRMVNRLNTAHYQQPPWSKEYPGLVRIMDHPDLPTGDVLERNVLIACKTPIHLGSPKDQLRFSTVGENLQLSTVAEAGFVDPNRLDFKLRPESAVFKKLNGFQPIPFEKIGLYPDEYRPQIPPDATRSLRHGGKGEVFDSNVDAQRSNELGK